MNSRTEYKKQYRQKNKQRILEYEKEYRKINKQRIKKNQKKYNSDYYLKNRGELLQKTKIRKTQNWSSHLIWAIKVRTKKKKFATEIDFDSDYLKDLFKTQNGKCYWSNLKMLEQASNHNLFQVSVDRLDNNKSYTKDNIVLCCLMINYARNNCDFNTWTDIMKNQISIKYRRNKS